jgi:hypothetical protein
MPITESQARDNLKALLTEFGKLSAEERKTMSEASVVRQFVDRLLEEVLGWPIKDPQRYKYEMHTQAGRPDLTLFPEKGGVIFVEAKRFGIIKQLEEARYTISGVITPGRWHYRVWRLTGRRKNNKPSITRLPMAAHGLS